MPISNTIPNTGKIHTIIKDIHQGQGSRKIPALLDKIVKEFRNSFQKVYRYSWGSPIWFWRNAAIGLLVSRTRQTCWTLFLSECPILRKNKKTKIDTSGRVDFWIRYEDFDFVYGSQARFMMLLAPIILKTVFFKKWDEANNFQNSRIKEHAKAASVNPE